MIRVSGSSVVSVRNGLSSTVPLSTTERRWLIGNSGFVTAVGSENGGATRSARSSSGASGKVAEPGRFEMRRRWRWHGGLFCLLTCRLLGTECPTVRRAPTCRAAGHGE